MASVEATTLDGTAVLAKLRAWAGELGFQQAAVSRATLTDDVAKLTDWLTAGHHGEMHWLERNQDKRAEPAQLVPGTVTVITLRMDYLTDSVAAAWDVLADAERGYIARYALGRDYHKILRQRLLELARRLATLLGPHGHRVFTDSAPVLERALARDAGLGWVGKHTNLIARDDGSLFLLGEIFTSLELPADLPVSGDHCGSCTRCIEVCPTRAIIAPYRLDARLCISYLTIEFDGSIPETLRPHFGNRVFGCDDCQLVCPWNRYAKLATVSDFAPRAGLDSPTLIELFNWSAEQFDAVTRGSALRRVSHEQWLRNVAIALGNAPTTPAVVAALVARRDDARALVREHVGWALARHGH